MKILTWNIRHGGKKTEIDNIIKSLVMNNADVIVLTELIELNWTDSWRYFYPNTKDYTWYSKANNGFRIDYAFVTPSIKDFLFNAYHSHNERIKGFSDHSPIIIEIDIETEVLNKVNNF